ncbi:MAG: adenine nucleotide alpha hydrolase [Desulfovibrio sp.]|nr:adenine nucleotide alpha hydrolase [Desulfovibrio sp.]
MRFALAYSCGKDSTFALHKMLAAGHEPVCLITMFREDQERSWFHGADRSMLKAYQKALGLPMLIVPASGSDYAAKFEQALTEAAQLGAAACAFGDIDLEPSRRWQEARCKNTGLASLFPLWQRPRREIIDDILSCGYNCLIKTINTEKLGPAPAAKAFCTRHLGQFVTPEFLDELEDLGLDACGENGEYHTLAVAGPVFRQPLCFTTGAILALPGHKTITVTFS